MAYRTALNSLNNKEIKKKDIKSNDFLLNIIELKKNNQKYIDL
jgi:hypothetical protein